MTGGCALQNLKSEELQRKLNAEKYISDYDGDLEWSVYNVSG
jgi:hypothetical protein